MRWLTFTLAAACIYLALRPTDADALAAFLLGEPSDGPQQLPDVLESIIVTADPTTYYVGDVPPDQQARNVRAFLDMLAVAEGTGHLGDSGYNVMFGGATFDGYGDHPRIAHQFTDKAGRSLWTSAAGRYQFMAVSPIPTGGRTRVNTWDVLRSSLGLPNFGPESQDLAAIELIRQKGALADVQAGRFDAAVNKVRTVWASLPGAGYAQHEQPLNRIRAAYVSAGGTLTA